MPFNVLARLFYDNWHLPVVIPVFANLLYSQRDGKLAVGNSPALICIGIGLACVNMLS